MASRALGVPSRRAARLILVATLTGCALSSAMRLVASRALGVAPVDRALLARVARCAAREQLGRAVRQAAVTARTILVPSAQRDARKLLRVTVATQIPVAQRELECVRLMALSAGDPLMKRSFRVRSLMAGATFRDHFERVRGRGVRLMATRARAFTWNRRMVGMDVRVTRCAGFLRATAHVMRRVTAGALAVGEHTRLSQHV